MSTSVSEHDDSEAARQSAWAEWFARNPEVLASWAHQNGYWPETATLTGDEEWDARAIR
jgi:hypothetical protein